MKKHQQKRMTPPPRFEESTTNLPILDFSKWESNQDKQRKEFVQELRWACHTVGFFLLKRHGIPSSICQQGLLETRHFFQRPLQQKLSISYERYPNFR